jgi:copper chaperone CopZ
MKKIQHFMLGLSLLLAFTSCATPIKNAKTETYKVAGNCEMCKSTIETAANKKGVSSAEWDKDKKVMNLTYDSKQTTASDILKRVAYAGYDNEQFLAPDEAYSKLPGCCKYDRMKKEIPVTNTVSEPSKGDTIVKEQEKVNQLSKVYDQYFALKDALVKDDGTTASSKALALTTAIKGVDMKSMSSEEHSAWMKVEKDLLMHAEHIGETKDIAHQREHFSMLSENIYTLVKVFRLDKTVYLQHCPMYNDGEGANWLSKENAVKNPYYGSSMLTCGKTTETIR